MHADVTTKENKMATDSFISEGIEEFNKKEKSKFAERVQEILKCIDYAQTDLARYKKDLADLKEPEAFSINA